MQRNEFVILPEGNVPSTIGQTCLSLDITSDFSYYIENQDFLTIRFTIYLIKRTREVPHDRLSELDIDKRGFAGTHSDIKKLICNLQFASTFKQVLNEIGSSSLGIFKHQFTKLTPLMLSADFFTKKPDYENPKIAGFKTWQTFITPRIYDYVPIADCFQPTIEEVP